MFNKEELARYNSKNGASAYIAYKEKVYDVSTSSQCKMVDIKLFTVLAKI